MVTKFRVSVWAGTGQFDGEMWFPAEHEQKARDAAAAIARPGSISAEPGDTVKLEKYEITEILNLAKPEVQ